MAATAAGLQPTALDLGTSVTFPPTPPSVRGLTFDFSENDSIPAANNGNLYSQTISGAGMSGSPLQSYTYDQLNRITNVAEGSAWSRGFQYDQYGNGWAPVANNTGNPALPMDGSTPTTQSSYNAATNQLTYATYDPRGGGNQTQPVSGGFTFTYDAENRLTSVTLRSSMVVDLPDPFGPRYPVISPARA
jgi:hypothetical protein